MNWSYWKFSFVSCLDVLTTEIFSHLIIIKTIFHQNNIHVKMFIRLANNERRLLIRLAVQCSAGHWALRYLHNRTVAKRFRGFGKFKVGSRLLVTGHYKGAEYYLQIFAYFYHLFKAAEYVFWHLLLREGYHNHVPTESWHCQNFLAQAIAPHTSPNFGTGLCA